MFDCILYIFLQNYTSKSQVHEHVYLSDYTMLGKEETLWFQTDMGKWEGKGTEPN